jgi:hypothetical protein
VVPLALISRGLVDELSEMTYRTIATTTLLLVSNGLGLFAEYPESGELKGGKKDMPKYSQ